MKKLTLLNATVALALCLCNTAFAQQPAPSKKTVVAWDGMMVAGYVNDGAYVNFGGPTLKFICKPFSIGFGILPTMRIKKDNVSEAAKKNSAVTPTAGFGFTFVYKHFAVQVPFYYNAKTATADGKWNPGVGIGFKF
jgi:hypothetical protein